MFYLMLLVAQAFLFFRVFFFQLADLCVSFFFFSIWQRDVSYTLRTLSYIIQKWSALANDGTCKLSNGPHSRAPFTSQYWRATFLNGLSDWSVLTNSRYPKVRFSSLRSFDRFRISHHSCRIAKIASLLIMSSSAISRICLSPSTLFTRP